MVMRNETLSELWSVFKRFIVVAATLTFAIAPTATPTKSESDISSTGKVSEAASADGMLRRTSIARLLPGQSYIRLANMSDQEVTHKLEVYGYNTRSILGRFDVKVPGKASVQIHPAKMLVDVLDEELDQFMAVYIDAAPRDQYFQHVRFDGSTGFFGDATACQLTRESGVARPAVAVNVHTSRIRRYTSFVWVHNTSAELINLEARVYDSVTGDYFGKFAIPLPPQVTYSASGIWYQSHAGLFMPTDRQLHTNIEFVATDGQDLSSLIIGHEVADMFGSNGTVNLSTLCAMSQT